MAFDHRRKMKSNFLRHFFLFFLFAVPVLAAVSGCGRKGPVRPLAKPLPDAPPEIRLQQLGPAFLLSWTLPKSNQDGSPLQDLEGFMLYKMTYDPRKDCPECRDTSLLWHRIDLEFLDMAFRTENRLWIWDEDVEPGKGYQYRVVPFTSGGREGKAALVRGPFLAPPSPPAGLVAVALDRLVRLSWEPLPESPVEGEWLGYRLYRGQSEQASRFQPVQSGFLQETRYEDFNLQNDISYRYGVRSVVRIGDMVVESALSQTVTAMPQPGK